MDMDTDEPRRRRPTRRVMATVAVVALMLLSAGEVVNAPLQLEVAITASAGPWPPTGVLNAVVGPAAPQLVARPGTPIPTGTAPPGPGLTVPILLYHYVRVNPDPRDVVGYGLSVTPAAFAQQMELLHADGATTITMTTLMDALAGHQTLPARAVVLTFDDGYADFATTAEPVLAQYGFVATDYVVSGFIGRPNYMTADQVRAMDAAGMVIGSHTVDHVNLPSVSAAVAWAEIDGGRSALTQLLGHPVVDFAYPYGGVNALDELLVQRAGFREAVTTASGYLQALTARYLLHRLHVGGSTTLALFARAVGLPPSAAVPVAWRAPARWPMTRPS